MKSYSKIANGTDLYEESYNFGPFLFEKHYPKCTCSYCKENLIGLVLPKDRKNGWKSIRWHYRKVYCVLRWIHLFKSFR